MNVLRCVLIKLITMKRKIWYFFFSFIDYHDIVFDNGVNETNLATETI